MLSFLLDENLPPSLAVMLKSLGYDARHVVEIDYTNKDDFEILLFAEQSGEIILTHDTDFGTLLALHKKSSPSVILFRLEKLTATILFDLLQANLSHLQSELSVGAIVVIEENGIRIRKLPIVRG